MLEIIQKLKNENHDLIEEISSKDKMNKQFNAKIEDLNQIYDNFLETKQKVNINLIRNKN